MSVSISYKMRQVLSTVRCVCFNITQKRRLYLTQKKNEFNKKKARYRSHGCRKINLLKIWTHNKRPATGPTETWTVFKLKKLKNLRRQMTTVMANLMTKNI